jgi:Fur-regulated basic protein A
MNDDIDLTVKKGELIMQSVEKQEKQRERVLNQLINYGCYKADDGRHLYELSVPELETMYTEIQKQRINAVLWER